MGTGLAEQTIDHPVVDGVASRDHAVLRVLTITIALTCRHACAPCVIHACEEARVYQIIRVEDADCVVAILLHQLINDLTQCVALGAHRLGAFHNQCASAVRFACGVVGAIIRNDDHVIQFLGVILRHKRLDQVADDRLLVACGNQYSKPAARCLLGPLARRTQRIGEVECKVRPGYSTR